MTLDTAYTVARRIADSGWNPRLEFARRGEPSLHPDLAAVISMFRRYNPKLQLQITTNGGGLLRKPGPVIRSWELFALGLNMLAIDDYAGIEIGNKIRTSLGCISTEGSHANLVPQFKNVLWREYPADKDAHPNHRYPINRRAVIFLEDIEKSKASRASINNHAGFGGPLVNHPKPCAKPFREIGINYDGSIDLCCIDWLSEYRIGNLHERSLKEIWHDEKFEAARRFLIRGQRAELRPCLGCDHKTYNLNWLPGKGGRGRTGYPEPTSRDLALVDEVNARGPVERPATRAMANVYPHLPGWLQEAWDKRRAT
jgi:radical SAM protein with 4Fe4S-binding SPASM domain